MPNRSSTVSGTQSDTSLNTRLQLKKHYDMVIIGGGIQGATLAWDASRNNISVLLVEAEDWGSGTSANNLKVIHGGIRYIQNFNIKRSIQSIREQSLLRHLAPNLIRPLNCSIPAPTNLLHNKYSYWLAFKFFDLLKILVTPRKIKRIEGHTRVHQAKEYFCKGQLGEELIRRNFLEWQDAQVQSPERLVFSFIQSAQELGAVCYNHVKAVKINLKDNEVQLLDQLSGGSEQRCAGDFLIDTTGPWHNKLNLIGQKFSEKIRFAQGVNLFTRRKILSHTLGLETQKNGEKRLLYVTPWRQGTLFGTWYFEDIDHCNKITENILVSCLSDLNKAFPNAKLDQKDISMIHSGLLPLKEGSFTDLYSALNDKTIFKIYKNKNNSGLCASIIGVKYTTARQVSSEFLRKNILKKAYRSVYKDIPNLRLKYSANQTEREQLSATIHSICISLGNKTIIHLVENYGFSALLIVDQIKKDPELAALIPGCDNEIKAELSHCLESEAAYTLADLLIRRIGIGAVGMPSEKTINYSSKIMAAYFRWDDLTTKNEITTFKSLYQY